MRSYAAIAPASRRKLFLVGSFTETAEEQWSQTLARELGVEPEIEVTGDLPRERVLDTLRSVYVQSSAFEGLPNAMLEAATCGVPLVATAVGGMKEVLRDEVNALVVPHGDRTPSAPPSSASSPTTPSPPASPQEASPSPTSSRSTGNSRMAGVVPAGAARCDDG